MNLTINCKNESIRNISENPEEQKLLEMVLEEAARQWCEGLADAPERADGEGFAEFFYEIFEQKEEAYREQLSCE